MKKVICFLMAVILLLSAVPAFLAEDTVADGKAAIVSKLTDTAVTFLHIDENDPALYANMRWTSIADILPAGAVISVVQRQSANTTEGLRYFLPFINATGEEVAVYKQVLSPNPTEHSAISWSVGIINQNESFVCVDDVWYDWKNLRGLRRYADRGEVIININKVSVRVDAVLLRVSPDLFDGGAMSGEDGLWNVSL